MRLRRGQLGSRRQLPELPGVRPETAIDFGDSAREHPRPAGELGAIPAARFAQSARFVDRGLLRARA
jgi:hypothetical protein